MNDGFVNCGIEVVWQNNSGEPNTVYEWELEVLDKSQDVCYNDFEGDKSV